MEIQYKPIIYRVLLLAYIITMILCTTPFSFMALNVFLAWLPIEFGCLTLRVHGKWRYLFSGIWLLFFPNIPYLLTDLLHLESLNIYRSGGGFQNDPKEWLFFLLLVLPIIVMVVVGMNQVFQLVRQLPNVKRFFWLYLFVLAFLAAIAIYIGRFDRIHSIELLLRPLSTLNLLLGIWNIEKLQFVLLFMIIQLVIWLLLKEITQRKKEE
ncbi:DUF1361 domain-containing protein [Enterococcus pallens]|uniref:DUF1361 domain-containing protein n=1 Tax=Enterococcus pallens ATCC BAA-351 TaxID=1158607 RepID=R2SS15_9ENTE|nr:DUF1361 domain-containing protein [Enterococcus pallens]EOH98060.1 hypothetical protein UAU_00731 [Enterococcus pallens ATCC BAA-351]EOU20521.1 hypothetical protein I588_01365 [Enterococcus pallens ATCC BAA-351]OJG80454.1 hypothetical protein RV10_GL004666 [Enterococcus pallens]